MGKMEDVGDRSRILSSGRRKDDVPKRNGSVIPLQHDGPGLFFMTIQGSSRNPGNLLVQDDGYVVDAHSNLSADKRHSECVPLVVRRVDQTGWSQLSKDRSRRPGIQKGVSIVSYLNLIPASQIDSTSPVGLTLELKTQ